MSITIDATYEQGTFKPEQPVTLPEGAHVRLTIVPAGEESDPLENVIGIGESGRTDGAEKHDKYLYGTARP